MKPVQPEGRTHKIQGAEKGAREAGSSKENLRKTHLTLESAEFCLLFVLGGCLCFCLFSWRSLFFGGFWFGLVFGWF